MYLIADRLAVLQGTRSMGRGVFCAEPNAKGQTDRRVRFLSRGRGYGLFLTSTAAVLALHNGEKPSDSPQASIESALRPPSFYAKGFLAEGARTAEQSYAALRINLVGANASAQTEGLSQLPGTSNYFIGNNPKQWRVNVPTYAKVKFHDVYPGVDLVYYGNQQQLEHDFIVAPGAAPTSISLGFDGAQKISINEDGDLRVKTGESEVVLKKPVLYQESGATRAEVVGKYVVKGKNRVGFEVARYDVSKSLVIDPILVYASYLGGSSGEIAFGIAVDSTGAAYVTGHTTSADFPVTPGAFQTSLPGCSNCLNGVAFVSKMSPGGSTLVYSTYLGGHSAGGDGGTSIALDSAGSAYVTGTTQAADFPTTPGAFQTASRGPEQAFVTKLNATGTALTYSTYLGGSNARDDGFGIAVDSGGSAYVIGSATSADFPTTPSAYQPTFNGDTDLFITKMSTDGSSLVYSTYLGGTRADHAAGIAVDSVGSAYVTGYTNSTNFPTTPGAFQATSGGIFDAFAAKLSANGSALMYSTYLGGSGFEQGQSIAVDASGSAYVTGFTHSANFPITPGAFQTTMPSFFSAFVTKFNAGGSLVYSTFLGGDSGEAGYSIAVDSTGSAYVTGSTFSANFPVTAGAFQPSFGGGGSDAFVTKLSADGSSLAYSSYLGGNGAENGQGIVVDSTGSAYVTGYVAGSSSNFPVTPGAFQTTYNHGDAFIAKVTEGIPVAIEIQPGENPPTIDSASQGKTPVAILSTATFDATTRVNRTSLTFGRTGNEASLSDCSPGGEDVNGDGLLDLVCHFNTPQTGFKSGTTMGVLKGRTVTGTLIQGSEAISVE